MTYIVSGGTLDSIIPTYQQQQLGDLGEHCKFPQRGLWRSPSQNRTWCILALKSDIWWHQFKWFPENELPKFRALFQIQQCPKMTKLDKAERVTDIVGLSISRHITLSVHIYCSHCMFSPSCGFPSHKYHVLLSHPSSTPTYCDSRHYGNFWCVSCLFSAV